MATKLKRNINKPIELEVLKQNAQLGNVPNVTTNNQTPTWSIASALNNIKSGETLSTVMGKIAKAIDSIISHINNKSNPHGVTKSQIGLGNVDNTADINKNVNYANSAGTVKEANITWGGKNFSGNYGCIDASMISELGANRFAFLRPEGVTIEYSRDNGKTWLDYDTSDYGKTALFSIGYGYKIGKADAQNTATKDYKLRVTINTGATKGKVYTQLNKFCIYVSTSGSKGCTCTIDKALESTPNEYINVVSNVPISGWSGYNIINVPNITTYGNSPTSQYGRIRFTFESEGGDTSKYIGLSINQIMGFGGVGWTVPSNMAKNGHLYSYDASQNATFPANISASRFVGKADSATKADSAVEIADFTQGSSDSFRSVYFGWNGNEKRPVYNPKFQYNPATDTLKVGKVQGKADSSKSADSVSWNNVSGRPTNVSAFNNDKGYLTSHQSLTNYALKSQVPTKTSQLTNDSGYLTSHQSLANYYKKTETYSQNEVNTKLNGKLNTTDVSAWAKASTKPTYTASEVKALPNTTTLANLSGDTTHRTVTDAEKTKWNNKSNFSGSYNDLKDKPTIPSGVVVIDNLTSTSATASLSANQGKVLNDKINNRIIINEAKPSNQIANDIWYQIIQ